MPNLPDKFKNASGGFDVYLEIPKAWIQQEVKADFPRSTWNGVRRKLKEYFAWRCESEDGTNVMVLLMPTDEGNAREPLGWLVTQSELDPILDWFVENNFPRENALTYDEVKAKFQAGEYKVRNVRNGRE